jgi:integrase
MKYHNSTITKVISKGQAYFKLECRYSGKRIRKRFKTEAQAKEEAFRLKILYEQMGTRGIELDRVKRDDALQAFDILSGYTVSLRDVAQFYIKHHPQEDILTFGQCIDKYIEYYQSRISGGNSDQIRPDTLRDIKFRASQWRVFSDLYPDQLTKEQIKEYLFDNDHSSISHQNNLRHLNQFYRWIISKGYASTNPAIDLRVRTPRKNPEIYEPNEVRKILKQTKILYPQLIPYMSILFFAGVRPYEAMRLDWYAFDWDRSAVLINHRISKTHTDRWVSLKPNLIEFLQPYQKERGLIFPMSRSSLNRYRRKIFSEAQVKVKQDGARHSFATYNYLAEGLEKTLDALGHIDSKMLIKSYKNQMVGREAQAIDYFSILP